MRSEMIRIVVLIVTIMLTLAFVLPWLRGTDLPPVLMGIVAVGLIATNLLRSFRGPLWRLRRPPSQPPRRYRERREERWWPRGVRQPTRAKRRRPSAFALAGGITCTVVFAAVFFWPSDQPPIAAGLSPSRAVLEVPAQLAAIYTPEATHSAVKPSARRTEADGTFRCTVTGVHDGDGPIYCAEGQKIRLQAIAAREADETCRPGHPCPAASGAAATAALRRLALRKVLRCEATGTSYSRITAWCRTAEGVELNCAMVRGGTVAYWRRYDPEGRLCRS